MAYSDWTGMTGVEDLIGTVNSATDGVFGLAIFGATYLVLWTVITIAAARMGSTEPAKEAFTSSSFMMVFVTILMSVLEWVPAEVVVFPIVLGIVGIIILSRKNS